MSISHEYKVEASGRVINCYTKQIGSYWDASGGGDIVEAYSEGIVEYSAVNFSHEEAMRDLVAMMDRVFS